MEQNENYRRSAKNAQEACTPISNYFKISSVQEKTEWLLENGHNICEPGMTHALEFIHRIKDPKDLRKPQTGVYSITWNSLQKFIGNGMYDSYLSFENKADSVIDIKLVRLFNIDIPCYSLPLLRNIAALHELKGSDYFDFFYAQHRGMMTVIIGINGVNGLAYYDYSDEPGLVPLKSPL